MRKESYELHEYFHEVKARSRSQRINRREAVIEYSPTSEERRNGRIDFPRRFQRYEEIEREKERREEERRREQEAEEHRPKGKGKGDKGKAKSRSVGNYTITSQDYSNLSRDIRHERQRLILL